MTVVVGVPSLTGAMAATSYCVTLPKTNSKFAPENRPKLPQKDSILGGSSHLVSG